MPLTLPDPAVAAAAEVKHMQIDHEYHPDRALERVMADAKKVDEASLVHGLAEFHKERMAKVPSATKYPEAGPWIAYQQNFERELQRQAGFTDTQIAMKLSLSDFLRWRGFIQARVQTVERCRAAYIPQSDVGQIHIKNLDDPITYWKKRDMPKSLPQADSKLATDGVGNGLHIDDEPEEIFPLPARNMWRHYCDDIDGAVEFLTRYSQFWCGGNFLIHDWKGNSVAIEKASSNFIEVFRPGPDGRSHISGMTCRDPNSPQGKYQREKRLEYIKRFDMGEDCSDMRFWATCAKFEAKLSVGLDAMGETAKWEDVVKLFVNEWPDGLNKAGLRIHPDQGLIGYTLMVSATLYDKKQHIAWQREPDTTKFNFEPQVVQF
jgi:hypothetical protein